MPVSIGIQWPSVEEARHCTRGDLRLFFCDDCGFVWNGAFDPSRVEYSQRYDNSLDFSLIFQKYARNLAQRLVDTYDIQGKQVIEIGCGKGHFLSLLCEVGDNRGIGFDPSYEGARINSPAAGRITYIQDFYGQAHTSHRGDLVCCRHVFEHIADPVDFLSMVRRTLGGQHSTIVYFEMPNVRFILEKLSIWDIIYEHCNYFSVESAAQVFERCGFEVLRATEAYDAQFVSIEARLTGAPESRPVRVGKFTPLAETVKHFSDQVRTRAEHWRARIQDFEQKRRRVVAWGGGSKAVSFLNMLNVNGTIPYVVDINPYKHGRYLPGTGQQMVPPSFLKDFRPQTVVLMNPIYRTEVEAHLRDLGVAAEVLNA